MVEVRDLTFGYSREAPLFRGFSWQVRTGELWSVIGASGCGKTTLLYLLAGLLQSPQGTVLVGGRDVTRPRPGTGLILQDHGLLPWASVRENARLGLTIRKFYGPDGVHAPPHQVLDRAAIEGRVDRWLERLGIAGLAGKYPSQLSGGQRQRTAIARTLALEPDLLLMDEPFSALDAPTRDDLQDLTVELRREAGRGAALTTVLVTHSIEEAAYLGEKVLVLGQPPNSRPRVLRNPGAGTPSYRRDRVYLDTVQEVRSLMGRMRDDALRA